METETGKHSMKVFTSLLLVGVCGATVRADVKLPAIFSDHMVVQAESAAAVWGGPRRANE